MKSTIYPKLKYISAPIYVVLGLFFLGFIGGVIYAIMEYLFLRL